jgi:hypothetical protein
MKRDIRRALLAMLMASVSLGAMQVHAAPGDPGEAIYGGGDKLLGGQDIDGNGNGNGDGYADPYGTAGGGMGLRQNGQNAQAAPGQGAGMGAGSTTLVNVNNGADAAGQAAGGPALKRKVRGRGANPADPGAQTPDAAAQSVYGMTGAKPAARKTTEIYRSPY